MNDLFPIPETPLPPLEAARRRMAQLTEAYLEADANEDNTGEPVPKELIRELNAARSEVARLEQEAMRK